jgi:sulfatase modifying factor 1
MQWIGGGEFWMGSESAAGKPEESPRFKTRVADFCLDRTEVTMSAYHRCVAAGACSPAHDKWWTCNTRSNSRSKHPANCVDWHQADSYCRWRKARLPTEVEWEYAARGGAEGRRFSWGDDPPEGRSCYKHVGGSCAVGQYPAGVFGLYDMTGNVWEWTDTWYGPYPWPPVSASTRVYRGGSWSRRFVKWMSTTLRNRYRPRQWGSHLGFRCALLPPATACPFGVAPEEGEKRCLHGLLALECDPPKVFNGLRCALPGSPECRAGRVKRPGHGCVLEHEVSLSPAQLDLSAVSRSRSPEFDADCSRHYPGRPHGYRYSGGSHAARNVVSRKAGCSNRDVGVGYNSTCCP